MTSNLSQLLQNSRLKLVLGDTICLSMKGPSFSIVTQLVRVIDSKGCEFGGSLEFYFGFVEMGLLVERRMGG